MLSLMILCATVINGQANEAAARLALARQGLPVTENGFLVACQGAPDQVDLFLQAGMSPDGAANPAAIPGGVPVTPLGVAVLHQNQAIIARLLAAGADIEKPIRPGPFWLWRERSDYRPLHLASEIGASPIVRLLLEAGADLAARDAVGRTPLRVAIVADRLEITELLLAEGAAVNDGRGGPLGDAARFGRVAIAQRLLQAGASVTAEDRRDRRVLHIAAIGKTNRETVELLIAAGAELQARDKTGYTPLMTAKARDNTRAMAILEAVGAELSFVDRGRMWIDRRTRQEVEMVLLAPTPIILLLVGLWLLRRL